MNLGEIVQQRVASIDINSNNTTNNSKELPAEIEELVTGEKFWRDAKINRYKMLIRQGHLRDLLDIAKMAREQATREHPSHFFAKWASKKQWERTLETLAKIRQVARDAAEVAKRILARPTQMKAVYKACWRFGSSVIHKAVLAEEIGRDRFKYFNWLCRYKTDSNTIRV